MTHRRLRTGLCAAALLAVAGAATTDLALLAGTSGTAPRPSAARHATPVPTPTRSPIQGAAAPAVDLLLPPHSTPRPVSGDVRPLRHRLPPDSVAIPRQHVVAPVGICSIVDAALEPPADVHQTCRWAGGAGLSTAPTGAASQGTTAVTGHINWAGQGTGALGRLGELHPGDVVLTSGGNGAVTRWRITAVTYRNKSRGVDLAAFAGQDGPRVLYLISCGGAFDSGELSYVDNIYVRAVPELSPRDLSGQKRA